MEVRKVWEPDVSTATFQELPIIDLADMENLDPSKRAALASRIYDACTQVGFFYIKDHGIPEESIQKIMGEAGRFFKDQCWTRR